MLLCVCSGVLREYLKQPELTSEVIVHHPTLGRLYKTGDLVRIREDGNIIFLGRVDFQVKINGQRLELGEIEATILKHPQAASVVVMKRENKGRAFLAAYVAVREREGESKDKDSDAEYKDRVKSEVISLCKKSLAPFMVPSAWVLLDRMPLNANGKVDRKALPAPEFGSEERVIVAPRNAMEKKLLEVFCGVLQRSQEALSVDDDFFGVGGSSLQAMTLLTRLRDVSTELSSLSVADVFRHSSVAALAQLVASRSRSGSGSGSGSGSDSDNEGHSVGASSSSSVKWSALGQTVGLASRAQQRIFLDSQIRFEQQGSAASSIYNIPMFFRLDGDMALDLDKLSTCLSELVHRHQSLRTALEMDGKGDQGLVQRVLPWSVSENRVQVWQRTVSSDEALKSAMAEFGLKPFDLSSGDNLRCCLVTMGAGAGAGTGASRVLGLCVHHAFFDGLSTQLLQRELSALFRGERLAPLPLQYLDYAQHEAAWLASDEIKAGLDYWKRTLDGAESLVTDLPYDRPKQAQAPATATTTAPADGASVTVAISPSLRSALEKWQADSKSTLFMTLMASLHLLLHKITQQNDICVGSFAANRYRPELEGLIGMFVNTLPYRVQIDPTKSFAQLQEAVRSLSHDVMQHSAVPFDLIVQQLAVIELAPCCVLNNRVFRPVRVARILCFR